jgi:acetyl esterase/lipase
MKRADTPSQVAGDCLYADWIGAFFVPWIHRTNAIVVLPNYRLIPEHSGADILEDLRDFWTWFNKGSVDDFLHSQTTISDDNERGIGLDYEKILVTGDSAGGYMALMSALTQPRGSFNAVFAQYPMTNYMRCEPVDTFFGQPSPPEAIIAQHLSTVTPDTVVSSGTQPARMGLSYALAAYGHYLTYFGTDEKMWPIGLVEEKKKSLPSTWIVHGDADSAVSVEDTRKFVGKCTGLEEGVEVKVDIRPGQEHGFDGALKEDEEAWLKEGLAWVEGKWLRP